MNITKDDLINIAKRAFEEAEQGQLNSALERINASIQHHPEAAILYYSEGRIHHDEIGSATKARELFGKALELEPSNIEFAWRLCDSSTDEEDWNHNYKHLLQVIEGTKGDIKGDIVVDYPPLYEINTHLDNGALYGEVINDLAITLYEQKQYGSAASHMQQAINSGDFDQSQISGMRRTRAFMLRELDKEHVAATTRTHTDLAPENRLPLLEANEEWLAISTEQPTNSESWNALSVNYALLIDGQSAKDNALKAIEYAPSDYAKPYINLANACRLLGEIEEGRAALEKAKALATEPQDLQTIINLERYFQNYGTVTNSDSKTEALVFNKMKDIIIQSAVIADNEAAKQKGTVDRVIRGVYKRYPITSYSEINLFMPFIRELLQDFSAEFCFQVFRGILKKTPKLYPFCIRATAHLVHEGDPHEQSDAAKVYSLFIMSGHFPNTVKKKYKKNVLTLAVADTFHVGSDFKEKINNAIQKISPDVLVFLKSQTSPTQQEIRDFDPTIIDLDYDDRNRSSIMSLIVFITIFMSALYFILTWLELL